MVTGALHIQASMRLFNALKTLNTLKVPLHIRVSCHKGEAIWDPDLKNLYGKAVNDFLKSEKVIGLENRVTVTEEVYGQLDEHLQSLFTPYKNHSYVLNSRKYERTIYASPSIDTITQVNENYKAEVTMISPEVSGKEIMRSKFLQFFGLNDAPSIVAVFQDTYAPAFTIRIHDTDDHPTPLSTPDKKERPDQAAVFWDLRAASAIAGLCANLGIHMQVERDGYEHIRDNQRIIAIGLHNGAAYKARGLCPEGFFDVWPDEETKMANFQVNGIDFFAKPIPDRGVKYDQALIVRTLDGKGKPYFVCGGHDGQGTFAAGLFLAERWPELMDMYSIDHSLDKHSLSVIISFDHDSPLRGRMEIYGKPQLA